ncbi:MAG: hypothetical protein HY059_13710 [Proteobacteria bacterium]|nr:hypothetical protein [Pseudomonadota bacterium]
MRARLLSIALALAAAPAARAFEFTWIMPCRLEDGEMDPKAGWCVDGRFGPGRRVSSLEGGCSGVTESNRTIQSDMDDADGTSLKKYKCANDDPRLGVLDAAVKSYRPLEVKRVPAAEVPPDIERRVRGTDGFKPLLAEAVKRRRELDPAAPEEMAMILYEIPLAKKRKAYLAAFSEDGYLPYLVDGKSLRPLAKDGTSCTPGPTAFELNKTPVLSVLVGECFTDGGSTQYIELSRQ